ncbi:DUF4307 domain-containing protein [Actinotalea fermentans]|uniref:DUF4307 domain-containing protein n=1 Tax=Actinotalea fermentans TaxID=43671 RepID=A0A511YWT5_9CELL|nr:DUF4307 domain-containing protein [Actinotalea fermentans]KGM16609.1 hypothetical protein N867_18270 [Actinotalea fermentans ATCC 43279 = JCM 9966 = DSM 3133]GEN79667.1 hypothetical protein AFE02nite_14010 [Actinotalea fermentans]
MTTQPTPGPAATPSGAPLAPPPGRYGRTTAGPSRRLVVVALAAAGLAGLALAVWLGLRVGVVPVDWHDVGFRVEGDDLIEVTFDVTRPDPSRPASCVVEALNEGHAQVGVVTVDVAPSEATRVRLTTPLRTSELAVSGTVRSCRLTD